MSSANESVPIRLSDRVSDVLARDEALVEVLVRLSPVFSKLRSKAMRRVMARLVTVEQAARMARMAPQLVVDELNTALGSSPCARAAGQRAPVTNHLPESAEMDRHPPFASVVQLDLRAELRAGHEPFSRIMGTVGALREHDVLMLRTIFEPVPLFAVLAKRGFLHEAVCHAADDWTVWFWRCRRAGSSGT